MIGRPINLMLVNALIQLIFNVVDYCSIYNILEPNLPEIQK